MSIQQWHIDKCEDSVYPVKTPAGNWMRTVDVIAALAAKEREWWVRIGKFRKALNAAGLHGHYNLLQEHFQDESGKWEAKEREIERLTEQVERLSRPFSEAEVK